MHGCMKQCKTECACGHIGSNMKQCVNDREIQEELKCADLCVDNIVGRLLVYIFGYISQKNMQNLLYSYSVSNL